MGTGFAYSHTVRMGLSLGGRKLRAQDLRIFSCPFPLVPVQTVLAPALLLERWTWDRDFTSV